MRARAQIAPAGGRFAGLPGIARGPLGVGQESEESQYSRTEEGLANLEGPKVRICRTARN